MEAKGQAPDLSAVKAELRRLRQYLLGRAADAQAAGELTMAIPPAEYSEFAKSISKAIACIEAPNSPQTTPLQAQIDATIQQMVKNAAAKQSAAGNVSVAAPVSPQSA